MIGFLCLNKPGGWTSRRAADAVGRAVRPCRVGHAGTLDPLATGVLVVAVGAATRLVQYLQQQPKSYQGTFLLGRTSPTEDVEGPVTELANPTVPTCDALQTTAIAFTGEIQQRPPAYSAVKIAGQRAYKLARRGETVDLLPRPVTIHKLKVLDYDYPRLRIEVGCSSGTYIRSLGRDLARALGSDAVMAELTRTAVGPFCLEDAIEPSELGMETCRRRLVDPRVAVTHLPHCNLTELEMSRAVNGQDQSLPVASEVNRLAAFAPDGRLVGVLARAEDGRWHSDCILPTDA